MNLTKLKQVAEMKWQFWLVEASGDGQRNSKLISGDMSDVKRCLADMMWLGPYEEAMKDEMVSGYVNSLDDPDNWRNGVWYEDGEQCWFRVSTVDDSDSLRSALQTAIKIIERQNLELEFYGEIKNSDKIIKHKGVYVTRLVMDGGNRARQAQAEVNALMEADHDKED